MGLDMFAFAAKDGPAAKQVDVRLTRLRDVEQLHYWRKHPNLHGWMAALYRLKGGREKEFNCVSVRLTLDDLAKLEDVVRGGTLPMTSGFFFGESDGSEKEGDLEFIAKARRAIAAGKAIYYDSWW